jgi:hypothetical protein
MARKTEQIRLTLSANLKNQFLKLCDGKPLSYVLREYIKECVKKGEKL